MKQINHSRTWIQKTLVQIVLFLLSFFLITFVSWTSANEYFDEASSQLLSKRIDYWYGRGRVDRLDYYLAQLLRVYPEHPRLFEIQAILAFQSEQQAQALDYLRKLTEIAPESFEVQRLNEMLALDQSVRKQLSDARLLSLAGRYSESIEAWNEVYPEGPYSIYLSLEYWETHRLSGQGKKSLKALEAMYLENPYFIPIQLAIVRTKLSLDLEGEAEKKILLENITDLIYGVEALDLARQLSNRLHSTKNNLQFVQAILAKYPTHAELLSVQERMQIDLERHALYKEKNVYFHLNKGAEALEGGDPLQAERHYRELWKQGFKTIEIIEGLGYATLRQGRHSEALHWFLLGRAEQPTIQKWQQLIDSTLFWRDQRLLIDYLATGNRRGAQIALDRLRSHPDRKDYEGFIYLRAAELAAYDQNIPLQKEYLNQALAFTDSHDSALWSLFSLYTEYQSHQETETFYEGLSFEDQAILRTSFNQYQANYYEVKAQNYEADNKPLKAYQMRLKAYSFQPENPWLAASLANDESLMNDASLQLLSLERFNYLIEQYPSHDAYFAYALYLSRLDEVDLAYEQIRQIAPDDLTASSRQLLESLESRRFKAHFEQSWPDLLKLKPEIFTQATSASQIEMLKMISQDERAQTKGWYLFFMPETKRLVKELRTSTEESYTNDDKTDFYLSMADYAYTMKDFQQANLLSLEGLSHSRQLLPGELPTYKLWDKQVTDDWRTLRLERRSIETAQQLDPVLTLGFDHRKKTGTPGITELGTQTMIINLQVPFKEKTGYWFLQADPTWLNSGTADLTNSYWRTRFGTGYLCHETCDAVEQVATNQKGTSVGAGFKTERWQVDLGRSPVGFQRSEWIGGASYRTSLETFGVSAAVNRRILTNTLISFAGQKDPFSDLSWGPVVEQGINVGLSYDQGGFYGLWSSLGFDRYSGKNIAKNQNKYFMSGAYFRLYETEPISFRAGINTLFWGFKENASEVSFGHGNYYSPQSYRSVSLPVSAYGRVQNFSYRVNFSLGHSKSRYNEQAYFPANPLFQEQAEQYYVSQPNAGFPGYDATRGGGKSHSLSATLEYKINAHWRLGASFDFIRSETYTPNQGILYFKYYFKGSPLPVLAPPEAPRAYVHF